MDKGEKIEEALGEQCIPCLECDAGEVDGFGPMSFSCERCLGTGWMSVWDLRESSDSVAEAGGDVDLSGYSFENMKLSGIDLSSLIMSEADLSKANLSKANLKDMDLEGANLMGSDLRGADLTGTNLERARLAGAELAKANLTGANLTNTDLEDAASLEGVILKDVIGLSEEALVACLDAGAVLEAVTVDED